MKALALSLLLAASPAFASNWIQVAYSDNNAMFVDMESIAKVGKFRKVWTRNDLGKPSTVAGKTYYSLKSLTYFACAERQVTMTQASFSNLQGEVVHTYNGSAMNFLEVEPDTLNEAAFKFVCGAKL